MDDDLPLHVQDELRDLRRAVTELSMLNEVALAVGSARDLDSVIHALVRRSLDIVGAEQGVVTLVGKEGGDLAQTLVRTSIDGASPLRPDEALLGWMDGNRTALRLDDPRAHPVFRSFEWGVSVRSVLCAPLIAGGRLVGVITLYNKRDGAFSENDARLLTIVAMQSAQVVDAARIEAERTRVLNVFGRHTAPAVVEELLRYDAEPPSRRTQACVMFLDVRGFTSFAEQSSPEAVVDYLNALFDVTTDAVTSRGGIIHQLLGDGFMAIFGAPISSPDDCAHAVEASLDIVDRIEAENAAGRLAAMPVGIGLHAGEVVAGTVGSSHHREYKVTGDVVNVAARVEALNKEYGSHVLVTDAVWGRLPSGRFEAEDLGAVTLRGRSTSLPIFRLA